MDYTPYCIFFFLIDFDAIILHIYQCRFCEELIGQYGDVFPYLHTWIIMVMLY